MDGNKWNVHVDENIYIKWSVYKKEENFSVTVTVAVAAVDDDEIHRNVINLFSYSLSVWSTDDELTCRKKGKSFMKWQVETLPFWGMELPRQVQNIQCC